MNRKVRYSEELQSYRATELQSILALFTAFYTLAQPRSPHVKPAFYT